MNNEVPLVLKKTAFAPGICLTVRHWSSGRRTVSLPLMIIRVGAFALFLSLVRADARKGRTQSEIQIISGQRSRRSGARGRQGSFRLGVRSCDAAPA